MTINALQLYLLCALREEEVVAKNLSPYAWQKVATDLKVKQDKKERDSGSKKSDCSSKKNFLSRTKRLQENRWFNLGRQRRCGLV
jgi:hypothetical protein